MRIYFLLLSERSQRIFFLWNFASEWEEERRIRLNLYVCKSHVIIFYPSLCESIVTIQMLHERRSLWHIYCQISAPTGSKGCECVLNER